MPTMKAKMSKSDRLLAAIKESGGINAYPDDGFKKIEALIRTAAGASQRGYLVFGEFHEICKEKSRRKLGFVNKNSAADVEEVTRLAFSMHTPGLAVHVLRMLRGVELPTASALLAWTHPDGFPVIDQRAWRSLYRMRLVTTREKGVGLNPYDYEFYVELLVSVASRLKVRPIDVDRWLYLRDKRYQKRTA